MPESPVLAYLTPVRAGRTLWRTHDRQPRASSMPQTTIYAAPRTREQTPPPAVATHQLARLFGRSAALAGVSMRVDAGRTIALLGPNGAGKTTLLRILATSLRPSFGRAEVESTDIAARPDVVRQRVAYLPHATGLYDDLTAAENLGFAATMRSVPEPRAAVGRVLAEVGLVADADRRVRSFSAGMRAAWRSAGCCSTSGRWSCWTSRTPRSTPTAWRWSIGFCSAGTRPA